MYYLNEQFKQICEIFRILALLIAIIITIVQIIINIVYNFNDILNVIIIILAKIKKAVFCY